MHQIPLSKYYTTKKKNTKLMFVSSLTLTCTKVEHKASTRDERGGYR